MLARFLKNSVSTLASRIVNGLAQFGVTVLLARALAVSAYGQYAFGVTVGELAAVLAGGWMGLALVRDVAADTTHARAYFGTASTLRLLGSLVLLLLVGGAAWLLADASLALATLLGTSIGLVRALSLHVTSLAYALERMEIETACLFVEAAVVVAVVAGGTAMGLGVHALMGLLLGAYAFGAILRWSAVSGFLLRAPALPAWDLESLRRILQHAPAFFLFAVVTAAFVRGEVPLVTVVTGEENAGIYHVAAKIFLFLMLVPEGISTVFLPMVARDGPARSQATERFSRELTFWFLALSLPIAVGGSMVAAPLIDWLYGAGYASASVVLRLLLFAVPLRFLSQLQGTLLTGRGQQGARTRSMAIAAFFAAVGFWLGAWTGGLVGVALARLLAEALLLSLYASVLGCSLFAGVGRRVLRLVVPLVGMAAMVWVVEPFPVLWRIVAGAGVYLGLGFVTRTFDLSRVRALKSSA